MAIMPNTATVKLPAEALQILRAGQALIDLGMALDHGVEVLVAAERSDDA